MSGPRIERPSCRMDELIERGPRCVEHYVCGAHFAGLPAQGIRVAGRSRLRGRYRVGQRLDVHLVHATLAGRGRAEVEATPHALAAGAVLLIPAGHPFVLLDDRGAAWSTAWAHLDPRHWPGFPAQPALHGRVAVAPLDPLFGLLDAERDREDGLSVALRRAFADALALWLQRLVHGASDIANRDRGALQSLFERVRALPAEDWSSTRLAAMAGCSRSQLHRRCIAAFGRGPAAQVWRVRMQEAEYWLSATSLPVGAVAERLGYADAYHFSRAFKRWSGQAPSHFRTARSESAGTPNRPG